MYQSTRQFENGSTGKLLSTKGLKQMLHCTLFRAGIRHILNFSKQKNKKQISHPR